MLGEDLEKQNDVEDQDNIETEFSEGFEELNTNSETPAEPVFEEVLEMSSDDEEEPAEALEAKADGSESSESDADVEGTELESFESADIEDKEFIEDERVESIVESILFASDKPVSLATMKQAFSGTSVKSKHIKKAIENLKVEYAGSLRGVTLEEVSSGYQLRTKVDNVDYLKRMIKARPFKLSGPALEVLSIVAYKQPCIKSDVDEIRGVESGHLLRGLMDKRIVAFAGRSELPGKPMMYATTRKFLEIFGLRNLRELPTLSEIDEILPEGIGEEEEKETLGDLTNRLSEEHATTTYSEGEDELEKINEKLSEITTTSNYFEEEKRRQKEKRDFERAENIREALSFGEEVEAKDVRWLERYDAKIAAEAEAAEKANDEQGGVEAKETAEGLQEHPGEEATGEATDKSHEASAESPEEKNDDSSEGDEGDESGRGGDDDGGSQRSDLGEDRVLSSFDEDIESSDSDQKKQKTKSQIGEGSGLNPEDPMDAFALEEIKEALGSLEE